MNIARIESDRKQIALLERSQRLEREIITISELEQQRIGRDLHDGLCQYLAAITCAAIPCSFQLAENSEFTRPSRYFSRSTSFTTSQPPCSEG